MKILADSKSHLETFHRASRPTQNAGEVAWGGEERVAEKAVRGAGDSY